MKKKTNIILLSILAILIIALCTTYAYFVVVKKQKEANEISVSCLDISITNEKDDITLAEAYPLTDEEGLKLTPYTFTVVNNCDSSIEYEIKLELTGNRKNSISANAIKFTLDEKTPYILAYKNNVKVTLENAYEAYVLGNGSLNSKNASNVHSLRLWIDENAPVSESDKIFKSKISVSISHGLNTNTLADTILASYGGKESINHLTYEKIDLELSTEEDSVIENRAKYYWATDYEFDASKGYTLRGNIVQATVKECREVVGLCGKYTLEDTTSESFSSPTLYLITSLTTNNSDFAGGSLTYIRVKRRIYANIFNKVTTETDATMHSLEDDIGTSYLFRGNVENNYVKFGQWSENVTEIRGYVYAGSASYKVYKTLEECNLATSYNVNCSEVSIAKKDDDMYWRIVRINGDGTIRLIYDGTEAVANETPHVATIGATAYNLNNDNTKYVGYTDEEEDGTQSDSTIKSVIDKWYDTNLETNYGSYIADSIFCNDRTSSANQYTHNGSYDRFYKNKTPQLKCNQATDKYTVNAEYGNGYLSNPVGLITADELMLAGATTYSPSVSNLAYFLYSGANFWTNTLYAVTTMFVSDSQGTISTSSSNIDSEIRPVINLKSNVEFTGEGTMDSPYEIITN